MKQPFIGTISRWGTSLAIVVPKEILRAYEMERGDRVLFICEKSQGFMVVRISQEMLEYIGGVEVKI